MCRYPTCTCTETYCAQAHSLSAQTQRPYGHRDARRKALASKVAPISEQEFASAASGNVIARFNTARMFQTHKDAYRYRRQLPAHHLNLELRGVTV